MGFTPLEGLVMETRSGDIDPAIVTKLMREENLNVDEIDSLLNKKSGRLGFCKIGDFRLMKEAANEGNELAITMRKMQANRTKKYVGSKQTEYEYRHKKSKLIIDQIDEILAAYYGFTPEEVQYIKSYQLKYRMNDELENYLSIVRNI